jgi:catechol 2,3-dioxygenase-like lactoylglutathione lyase family enzyme
MNHIALTVSDVTRSITFYTQTLGIKATVRQEGRDHLLIGEDGLVFGLLAGAPAPTDAIHFGFELASAGAVKQMRADLNNENVPEVEWVQTEEFVSMKFLDPDGYIVEVFWESSQ